MREMDDARADTDAVLELAHSSGDAALRARALTVRGEIDQRDAAYDAAAIELQEAVRIWREVGDRRGEAEALRLWGFTSMYRGEIDAAENAISEALEISRELADRRGEAWALQNLAWAAFSRGDNDLAEQRLIASSNLFEEIGDFGGRGWAYGLLGYVWFFKGRLTDAAAVAEGGLEFTREIGDRWAYGMMLNLLASVRMWQGRTRESLDQARQAHRLFTEIDDKMGLVFSGMGVAWASVLTGDPEGGLELALRYMPAASSVFAGGWAGILAASTLHSLVGDTDTALSILKDDPELQNEPDLMVARALALLVSGDGASAYDYARRAWESGPKDPGERANYACVLSLAAAAAGEPAQAIEAGDEVGRAGGTYLDQIRAHLGRAFGYAQLADGEGARAALFSANRIVDATEDELHKALVGLAESVVQLELGGDFAPYAPPINAPRDRLEELGVAWRPWERAMRLAVTGGRSQAIAAPALET
jgi:tetratricopeptide (TPR) repeat protein